MSTGLFFASTNQWPLFRSLQLGDGFWRIAPDARQYHFAAVEAFHQGVQTGWIVLEHHYLSSVFFGRVLGLVYSIFAPHPLIGLLTVAWCASAMSAVIYGLVKRLGGSARDALGAALVAALWPSLFLWNVQLIRDTLSHLLLLVILASIGGVVRRGREGPGDLRRGWSVRLGWLVLLVPAAVIYTKTRPYAGVLFLAAGVVALAAPLLAQNFRSLAATMVSVAAVAAGVWVGLRLPLPVPVGWLRPPAALAAPARLPLSLGELDELREHTVLDGGNLTEMASRDISSTGDLVRNLPYAGGVALFAPFPWRLSKSGHAGYLRALSAVESALLLLALPGLALGVLRALGNPCPLSYWMIAHAVTLLLLLGLVVTNEGTLFRLRLQGLLPLVVVAIARGGFRPYGRIGRLLRRSPSVRDASVRGRPVDAQR